MKTRTAACSTLLVLAAALTACSSSDKPTADPTACKAALTSVFKKSAAAGDKATPDGRPPASDGLDDKAVQHLATEVLNEQVSETLKNLQTPQRWSAGALVPYSARALCLLRMCGRCMGSGGTPRTAQATVNCRARSSV